MITIATTRSRLEQVHVILNNVCIKHRYAKFSNHVIIIYGVHETEMSDDVILMLKLIGCHVSGIDK